MAREQHACHSPLPFGERALEPPALIGARRSLRADLAGLGFERPQRAVGLRNGALRVAQRVARLAPRLLLVLELTAERLDAALQRLEIFFFRGRSDGAGPQAERKKKDSPQALTFPCAETAAMRFATSSALPR
jgi:hypothetical protein